MEIQNHTFIVTGGGSGLGGATVQMLAQNGGNVIIADVNRTTKGWFEYFKHGHKTTFGRLDGEWKLKEVLPPARGEEAMAAENLDEDSSPEQVQWYYRQTRAN